MKYIGYFLKNLSNTLEHFNLKLSRNEFGGCDGSLKNFGDII